MNVLLEHKVKICTHMNQFRRCGASKYEKSYWSSYVFWNKDFKM